MTIGSIPEYLSSFCLEQKRDFFSQGAEQTHLDEVRLNGCSFTKYTNEFWTAGQRQGHSLHEISYRACFKAELPRFFIKLLTKKGDVVYDPFMGRGTALIEAALLQRNAWGNDINPLSGILARPRLNPPTLREIEERLNSILLNQKVECDLDLSMFYSKETLRQLLALRHYLMIRQEQGEEDHVDRWIRMVATNRLTGHSSGFFSVYSLPPNQAVSPQSQIKINEKRNQTPPDRNIKEIILKKSRSLQKDVTMRQREYLPPIAEQSRSLCCDARHTQAIPADAIDLVVTSPPFLDIVDYASDNWLRGWFNGLNAEEIGQGITMSRRLADWSETMKSVLQELKRVLKPGGWIAFEVGEVRNGQVLLDEVIAPLGCQVGLDCHGIVINQQEFTKTANCWGVKNNQQGTNTNRIVLFRKL